MSMISAIRISSSILALVFLFSSNEVSAEDIIVPGKRVETYYISSSSGDDNNPGTSPGNAIASLEKASKLKLGPGDRILLHSGDIFKGQLELKYRGTPEKPILISNYGDGGNPIIDGDGEEAAIYLINPDCITVENIEIINWQGVFGIYFTAEDAGEMKNLIFRNLEIHDVGANAFAITDPSKSIGGICGRVFKGESPSWWNGILIQNVYIHHVGSCGITFGNEVNLYKLSKEDPYYKTHKNVIIENCRIDSIVRDGIWIRQCEGAIIQHCEVSRTGMNAISNGIWFWDCLNSTMQYNEGWECMSPRGNDGAPFSIDNHCYNCTIQYNYSHDNEGPGYMIFGRMGDGFGNIVRQNISYNDNVTRTYKTGTASIALVSEVKGALVENNIIVAGRETHQILGHRNWEGFPVSATYRGNVFIGNGFSGLSNPDQILEASHFENNFFINVPGLPDALKGECDPKVYFNPQKFNSMELPGKHLYENPKN